MTNKKSVPYNHFTINQLALTYGTSTAKVREKMVDVLPIDVTGRFPLYALKDVTQLKDNRPETYRIHASKIKDEEDDYINTDPKLMSAVEKINHYKAEDLKESALIKKRKNDAECGRLMVAQQVERTTAEAFKKIALTLDTLPDALERDGIISSSDVQKVISILDNSREQLAIDLRVISLTVEEINERGEW